MKKGAKPKANNDLPDEFSFANDDDQDGDSDDDSSAVEIKRKFSPAEIAEFLDTCIILSRPELPQEQLDIIEASDMLSKIIRGIDMKYNGSLLAMFQSVKIDVTVKLYVVH